MLEFTVELLPGFINISWNCNRDGKGACSAEKGVPGMGNSLEVKVLCEP